MGGTGKASLIQRFAARSFTKGGPDEKYKKPYGERVEVTRSVDGGPRKVAIVRLGDNPGHKVGFCWMVVRNGRCGAGSLA